MGHRRTTVRLLAVIAAVAIFAAACGGTVDTETASTTAGDESDPTGLDATTATGQTTTSGDATTTSGSEAATSTSSVADTSTTSPAVTVTRPVPVPPTSTAGGDGLLPPPPSGSSWCEFNRFLDDQDDIGLGLDGGTDPTAVEAAFTNLVDVVETWAAVAPSEIQGDAALLLAGFGEMVDLLEQYDWDFLALTSSDDPAVAEILEGAAFMEANDRIGAYADANC